MAVCFILISCKNQPKEPKDYIDISSYLKGQLKYIDTIPFAFLKVVQNDSVYTDSQFISKEQVTEIVQPFLIKELEKKNFESNFKETSFADATSHTITITYESITENADPPGYRSGCQGWSCLEYWWAVLDLNQRPKDYESSALTN